MIGPQLVIACQLDGFAAVEKLTPPMYVAKSLFHSRSRLFRDQDKKTRVKEEYESKRSKTEVKREGKNDLSHSSHCTKFEYIDDFYTGSKSMTKRRLLELF